MCSRCRTPIPGDSTFCPMCGRKAPGLDSFDTLRQELPSTLGEAALAAAERPVFAVPPPPGEDPSFVTPEPEMVAAGPPRRTLVLAPGGAPLDPAAMAAPTMAVALSPYGSPPPPPPQPAYAHPGYQPRPPISGRFRAAAPVRIPLTPSPARIAIGVILGAVGMWLAVWLLPHYRDRMSEDVRIAIGTAAGALGLAAFALILTGALYRAQAEVRCRVCARPVIAWKGAFGLHCPLGPHHARINWLLVILTAAFWAGLFAAGIGFAVWLA